MVLSPDEKGELKGAGYNYRAKQSYFEELVLNGAQGRNRTRIGGLPLIRKMSFTQSEVLSKFH